MINKYLLFNTELDCGPGQVSVFSTDTYDALEAVFLNENDEEIVRSDICGGIVTSLDITGIVSAEMMSEYFHIIKGVVLEEYYLIILAVVSKNHELDRTRTLKMLDLLEHGNEDWMNEVLTALHNQGFDTIDEEVISSIDKVRLALEAA